MIALIPLVIALASSHVWAEPVPTPTISSPTVTAKVKDAVAAGADYAAAEKAEFERDAAEKLKRLETRIGALKERAKDLGADAKKSARLEVRRLESKSRGVRRKLRDFKASTVAAGRELKKGVSDALDDLADACEAAWKRLSS